ncbi:hypothetical protein FOA43_003667 [Brettanomyces nanus]|uniref:Uncharacterized protein n=1 Tax=Eeniella nana TaxID=13502 RepID=A0A875S3M5_EENNA|nr:uncharacterized protein FOA43_003667 [Brettanomyces nanus]QPG76281.1 hypothetical protein FOA43_003667 [Brettanomyces nanus]
MRSRRALLVLITLLVSATILGAFRLVPIDSFALRTRTKIVVEDAVYFNKDKPQEVQRENATLFSLVRNEELDGMLSSINYVETRFNKDYNYDWVFMNDQPFSEQFKTNISSAVSGRAIFYRIPEQYWEIPSWIDKAKMEKSMDFLANEGVLYARKVSYRQMCRFNSGFFYKMPIMDNYQYYWRVEPYIRFECDIPFDPFQMMRTNDYVYGFAMALLEDKKTIRKLWSTSLEFFETEHPEYVSKSNSLKFVTHDSDDNTFGSRFYNLCHYWTNFEIANLDFYRTAKYESYFRYLDKTGDFFYERWGDAPVHTLALSFMEPFDRIHYFANTGYFHNPNVDCPQDPDIYDKLHCTCRPAQSFSPLPWSCSHRFLLADEAEKAEVAKDNQRSTVVNGE